MIAETILNDYYNKIVQKADEMIPCEWERIALYAEEKENSRYVSFYYFTQDGKRNFSGAIPFAYDISSEAFNEQLRDLKKIIHDFWLEYQNTDKCIWYTLMLDTDKDRNIKVKYIYEKNDDITGWEGEMRWAYDEFGHIPRQKIMKKLLEKYLMEQGRPVPESLYYETI